MNPLTGDDLIVSDQNRDSKRTSPYRERFDAPDKSEGLELQTFQGSKT